MKIPRNYMGIAEYRHKLTFQINTLLDYLLTNDNYEEDLKIKAEIKQLRQKHKLLNGLEYAKITAQVEIQEITLESKLNPPTNENRSPTYRSYPFGNKHALASSTTGFAGG